MITWLMKVFSIETKKELLGIIMGALSFLPTFIVVCVISVRYSALIGIVFLIVSQYLWLNSISICTNSIYEKKMKYMLKNEELRNIIYEMNEKRKSIPNIICICGDIRYDSIINRVHTQLTRRGNIVLLPNIYDYNYTWKETLDSIHKSKIELCDEVYILNYDGKIDHDTMKQMKYALQLGKRISFLE